MIRATAEQNSCAQHFATVLLQMQINTHEGAVKRA